MAGWHTFCIYTSGFVPRRLHLNACHGELNRKSSQEASEFLARAFIHQPRLLRIARTRSLDQHRAEDAVSEALLKAMDRRHQLRDPARLYSWLVRIVIHQCYDQLRTREIATDIDEEITINKSTATPAHRLELVAAIETVLDAMLSIRPRTHRDVLIYFYYHGYDHERMTEILNLPVGTIKSRLSRARESLLKEFHKRGIKESDMDFIQDLGQWSEMLNGG